MSSVKLPQVGEGHVSMMMKYVPLVGNVTLVVADVLLLVEMPPIQLAPEGGQAECTETIFQLAVPPNDSW